MIRYPLERGVQAREPHRGHHKIRPDSAATGHSAALVRVKLRLFIGMRGGGAQLEFRGVQRLLDRPSAGRVIERGGQRQPRAAAQREHALHQAPCRLAHLADDRGAIVSLAAPR